MSNCNDKANNKTGDDSGCLYEAVRSVCEDNGNYFIGDETECGRRLCAAFGQIGRHATEIEALVQRISTFAKDYDFSEARPGNGFRSFVCVANAAIRFSLQTCRRVSLKRDQILFRKTHNVKDVESCNELLTNILICLQQIEKLKDWCPSGNLFVDTAHTPEELLANVDNINLHCFYGRSFGFQFCDSMRRALKVVSLSMAVFSETYYSDGSFLSKATTSVWTSGKYLLDPETRAHRIAAISQNANVDFCKAFWFLAESNMMLRLPALVAHPVAVSHVIAIPPEPLQCEGIQIPVPSAHLGPQPLHLRLISQRARQGMVGVSRVERDSPSDNLVFHCHGGGFIANSSRSHEIYLRDWARVLDAPIISVDYSLAPDAPFPRASQEVFYAYCWALNNRKLLGWTGKRVVFAGDSAGGNLCVGAVMRCIELGIRRPDGLFLTYLPVLIEFSASPSRMLGLMDPLLPLGFMMSCLKAYAGEKSNIPATVAASDDPANVSPDDTESFAEVSESDLIELQAHKSPTSETSDTLTNVSLSSQPVPSSSSPRNQFDVPSTNGFHSQKYVSEFLDKYVLESDTDSDGKRELPLPLPSSSLSASSQTDSQSFHKRFSGYIVAFTNRLIEWKNNRKFANDSDSATPRPSVDFSNKKRLTDEFKFMLPRDPYLSPYQADDSILKCLPVTRILSVELDPCLDDCVMFAKKLKRLDVDVDLEVLSGVPHGFLNFTSVSEEANKCSKVCVERIAQLFALATESQQQD